MSSLASAAVLRPLCRTCTPCRARKVACDGRLGICSNCQRLGFSCSYPPHAREASDGQTAGNTANSPTAQAVFTERRRARQACVACRTLKVRCSGHHPVCLRCRDSVVPCQYLPTRRSRYSSIQSAETDVVAEAVRSVEAPQDTQSDPEGHIIQAVTTSQVTTVGAPPQETTSPPQTTQSMATNTVSPPISLPVTTAMNNSSFSFPVGDEPHALDVRPNLQSQTLQSSANFALLPDQDTTEKLLHAFFTQLYSLPVFSFLHRATILQRFHAGLMDPALLHALVGTTSLLIDGTRDYSTRCIDTAERLVLLDIGRQSVVKVQTLLLITVHRMLMRRFSDAFVLFALAARIAYGVRLNFDNYDLGFLARESRCRLMWALFIVDGSLASGLADFRLCPPASIHLRLPCDEADFELDQAPNREHDDWETGTAMAEKIYDRNGGADTLMDDHDSNAESGYGDANSSRNNNANGSFSSRQIIHGNDIQDTKASSALALAIRMSLIRYRVIAYTKTVLAAPPVDAAPVQRAMQRFEADLARFAAHLPSTLTYSVRHLQLRAYSQDLTPFVKLHMMWHQSRCDLHRLTLVGLKEALPRHLIDRLAVTDPDFVTTCQRRCFDSAVALGSMVQAMLALRIQLPLGDLDLPVFTYQCVRILFFCYRNYATTLNIDSNVVTPKAIACRDIVQRILLPTPAIEFIYHDLERLIVRGFTRSSSASPEPQLSYSGGDDGSARLSATTPNQILSRHSFIKDVGHDTESESLTLPAAAAVADSPEGLLWNLRSGRQILAAAPGGPPSVPRRHADAASVVTVPNSHLDERTEHEAITLVEHPLEIGHIEPMKVMEPVNNMENAVPIGVRFGYPPQLSCHQHRYQSPHQNQYKHNNCQCHSGHHQRQHQYPQEQHVQQHHQQQQQQQLADVALDLGTMDTFQDDIGDFNFEMHSLGFPMSWGSNFEWLRNVQ